MKGLEKFIRTRNIDTAVTWILCARRLRFHKDCIPLVTLRLLQFTGNLFSQKLITEHNWTPEEDALFQSVYRNRYTIMNEEKCINAIIGTLLICEPEYEIIVQSRGFSVNDFMLWEIRYIVPSEILQYNESKFMIDTKSSVEILTTEQIGRRGTRADLFILWNAHVIPNSTIYEYFIPIAKITNCKFLIGGDFTVDSPMRQFLSVL